MDPSDTVFSEAVVYQEPRKQNIAEAAYYYAEQRGFVPGFEEQDWSDAERQVESLLAEIDIR